MIREHRPDVLPHIGKVITLSAAATQIKIHLNQERLIEDKAEANGHLFKGKRFKVYCQSSKNMKQIKDNEVDVAIFSVDRAQLNWDQSIFRMEAERMKQGVHSYKLFNKWINKVNIVSENDDRVLLSTDNLNGFQRKYIYENHMEDLKIIFNDKRIIFGVR